jgi:uncharacterized lipoprotein YddW (UPF0748 family)
MQREFRAAWIATVANIDWPTRPGLSTTAQKMELRRLLDRALAVGLNAVILQVRPAADAMYDSPIEPWSEYLTGTMDVPPEPYYDPLAFAVEEAHRRGLEIHAWFNPFRALHRTATAPPSARHVSVVFPELVRDYGEQKWLDPGDPRARDYSLAVILDVVVRYDIDGVHLDDYFYPYEVTDDNGAIVDFPDDSTWAAALESGLVGSRKDWRRNNVDRFVEDLARGIKEKKPWVRFGISPFGIWRPGHPPQIEGFDAYDRIYADSRKWLVNGWVDYMTPQLYWEIQKKEQSYPALLDWWLEQNPYGRHIWPGNFTSRVMMTGARQWAPTEILDQVLVTRSRDRATGNVHFSMKSLMRDSSAAAPALASQLYNAPSLVPETGWLGGQRPARPELTVDSLRGNTLIEMTSPSSETWLWVIRTLEDRKWTVNILPGWKQLVEYSGTSRPEVVIVSAVSRLGLEGPAQRIDLPAGP